MNKGQIPEELKRLNSSDLYAIQVLRTKCKNMNGF